MQHGLGVGFSIAPVAARERRLRWTGLAAPENEMSLNLPLAVLDI